MPAASRERQSKSSSTNLMDDKLHPLDSSDLTNSKSAHARRTVGTMSNNGHAASTTFDKPPNTIVAVVQCDQAWGDDGTRKLRIPCENSYTGSELQEAIVAHIRGSALLPLHESSTANETISVEVYDARCDSFVSLMSEGLLDVDVAARFGKLLRCIVHFEQSRERQKGSTLAIMGRFFHYDPNGIEFGGTSLVVKECSNNLDEDGTGLNVWDGSILLARYLEKNPVLVQGKRVLELGSGPGVVGIASALLGATEVVLTDLNYALPLMRENVTWNLDKAMSRGCCRMECQLLDWYYPPSIQKFKFSKSAAGISQPDVILVADCVWVEYLVIPLVNAIKSILDQCHPWPKILVSYQRRGAGAHNLFMDRLEALFGTVEELGEQALSKPDVMHIFDCRGLKVD